MRTLVASCLLVISGLGAQDPLSVLLIDGKNNHNWQTTTPVLVAILEDCGRFRVDVATATDVKTFQPKLAGYDVVVSNYNGPLWNKALRTAFVDYVSKGGGFVSVHAANNAFPEWKEYNEIIGLGGWGRRTERHGPYVRFRDGKIVRDTKKGRGGGHGRRHEFLVETRTDHPILEGLPRSWRHARDELYDKLRGPAKNLTVLATAWSDPKTRGTNEHEPMLMTIGYGKGRVFHTTLGHDTTSLQGVGFQITLQRGTEWAATGTVTIPVGDATALPKDKARIRDILTERRTAKGWKQLFDGKSLDGWERKCGTAQFSVAGGAIVGKSTEGSPNTYLCTTRQYADFELEFEVRIDNELNAGCQIRSEVRNGVRADVCGPQVEITADGNAGFVYGESLGTGWLTPDRNDPKKRSALRKKRWNQYRVVANGKRIRTWVNGVAIADFEDEKSGMASGLIALQIHSVPSGKGPFRASWRNLWLREIGKK